MEELVERGGLHAHHRLFASDEAFVAHVDRDRDRSLRSALAGARLEQEELALLHRELEVLNVAVVLLQAAGDLAELAIDVGHALLERGDGLGRAHARHHVFTLGVLEVFAVEMILAGGGIAREAHARARGGPEIAEHHGLDVHGGPEVVGDAVLLAVIDGAVVVPRAEHRVARHGELLAWVLRGSRGRRRASPAP